MKTANKKQEKGLYISLRMDGRVRGSGVGSPPWERLAVSLPPVSGSLLSFTSVFILGIMMSCHLKPSAHRNPSAPPGPHPLHPPTAEMQECMRHLQLVGFTFQRHVTVCYWALSGECGWPQCRAEPCR